MRKKKKKKKKKKKMVLCRILVIRHKHMLTIISANQNQPIYAAYHELKMVIYMLMLLTLVK